MALNSFSGDSLVSVQISSLKKNETSPKKKNGPKIITHKRTWRLIAMEENQSLNTLHEAIFYAFDGYDAHLYSFYMPNVSKRQDRVRNCTQYTHPQAIYNQSALFGFRPQPKIKYPLILKVNGESPEQYPDYNVEFEDDDYE